MNLVRAVRRTVLAALMGATALATATPQVARASELDDTTKSAIYLLRASMKVKKNGQHVRMLRALRQLHDPELVRLFNRLTNARSPDLQIHGILGQAECDPRKGIDLDRLANIDNAQMQWWVTTLAIDLDLLDIDAASELMFNHPDLHPSVRIAVATFLMRHKQPTDVAFLKQMSESSKLFRASLAALLLLQNGDPTRMKHLQDLNESESSHRDTVRDKLLRTAFTSGFERAAPWALWVGTEPPSRSSPALRRLALKVALRFNAPGAVEAWQDQFASATDDLERFRMALGALNVAHWVDPLLFNPLRRSDDQALRRMGEAGAAVASRREIVDAVIEVLSLNRSMIHTWALDYAGELAEDHDASRILLGLIRSFDGPTQGASHRLQVAVAATTVLVDHGAEAAAVQLRPILTDPQTSGTLLQGILLGLVQCTADPLPVIAGIESFNKAQSDNLALLIAAKHGHELSKSQSRTLALLVEGGLAFPSDLRLQAAWAYLKRTGTTRLALDAVLGPSGEASVQAAPNQMAEDRLSPPPR